MSKYNSMTSIFRVMLTIGFIILFQQLVSAQGNKNPQFLQKVGVLDSLYSDVLSESRQIYIQFPDSYDPTSNQKYPVAYILDGEMFLPTVHNVQSFYSGGYTPEMVLVGLSNANNRTRDLTTSEIKEMYGMPYKYENGKAEQFAKFIEKELIPYVEKKFPVTKYRTLIGHSYGGLFTIYTLLNHPHLFANYLAIDPSLDWDNQNLLKEAKKVLATKDYKNKSLFMSLGGQLHRQDYTITIDNVMEDASDHSLFARSNITFSNLLKQNTKNGLSFNWKFYPKDLHGTVPFPSIHDGLISLFEWYQMENTDKINSFDTPKEDLSAIVKHRAQKLQAHFGYVVPPYPEDLLNMSAYMNMDMNRLEISKMYFEFAIKYYPQSANVYDSMADFYERNGEGKKAIEFLTKAFEISGDVGYMERIEALKGE
jgi:predicted alpha/beta superfamily hydrolase